ncbi:MAG: methyltransferase domain-containing protein [Symploca sp. SIO1B1]|nr:methyltransferase domain-containing protein [Symploca sp. SIO1A3]NES00362.1 methyltransferase domain-containing protein [Symploca sp. SIO1B1]
MSVIDNLNKSREPSSYSNELFNEQWQLYQKILLNSYMKHQEIYGILHQWLVNNFQKPFSMLELGCGDASFTAQALSNTTIASYQGIDLSEAALLIAQSNMEPLPCRATFTQGELSEYVVELVQKQQENFDLILSSFALHHLSFEQKDFVMGKLLHLLKNGGIFLLIDVFRSENEKREDYLKRYLEDVHKNWSQLTHQEYSLVEEHIRKSDFPETQSIFYSLATKHGFTRKECLYHDTLDTTQMLCFYAPTCEMR